jgi:ribosomal protein L37E
MTNRTYTSCRNCGETHQNTRSSSLCTTCGRNISEQNANDKRERKTSFSEVKHDSFEDIETIHEMKEWIREYML